jgi:hypothetical protein
MGVAGLISPASWKIVSVTNKDNIRPWPKYQEGSICLRDAFVICFIQFSFQLVALPVHSRVSCTPVTTVYEGRDEQNILGVFDFRHLHLNHTTTPPLPHRHTGEKLVWGLGYEHIPSRKRWVGWRCVDCELFVPHNHTLEILVTVGLLDSTNEFPFWCLTEPAVAICDRHSSCWPTRNKQSRVRAAIS